MRFAFALAPLLACAATLAAAPPSSTPSPNPKDLVVPDTDLSKARDLVRKLGSEVFTEREEAEHDLNAMGRLARNALHEGANSDPDPEIRARCRQLLPRATAIEMKARLDTFLADADGRYEHDLPGWTRLRSTVRGEWTAFGWTFSARPRGDKAAREMFVEFLKTAGGRRLLTAIGTGENLGPLVAGMKNELYYARFPRGGGVSRVPSQMEVAAVMFADSLTRPSANVRNTLFTSVLTTSGIAQAAQGSDDKAAALRAVLNAWIDTRTDAYEMYAAMTLANSSQNQPAALRLAVRLLSAPGVPGSYRGQAMMTLGRYQSKEHLPVLERLIGDEGIVTTMSTNVNGVVTRYTITVGDLALVAAVQLTGQKIEAYHIQDRLKGSAATSISYTRFHIPEESRKEAATKYGWWRLKESLTAAK
ncbi:hypothetical protein R5W23_003957 [Gemmata sp. JC673]|uniref:HEAT repeat domain-containing protein n=1 Tax=Gemmata algarum TaxID=2975278 RepID=A0ABU5F4J1_9BACT|nr:hypothetical protein [Gemmata algarum]MDY3562491.1 hypothetical protein [Gemmata algarum]